MELTTNSMLKMIFTHIYDWKFNSLEQNNLCITGKWGSGKTTILKDLQDLFLKHGNNQYQFNIINVWEYEISDNPFYSILLTIGQAIGVTGTKTILEKLKNVFWDAIGINLKFYGFNLNSNFLKIKRHYNEDNINNLLKTSKQLIDEIVLIFNESLSSIDKKIIIAFDELDRCDQTMQHQFLNILKNIVFRLQGNIFFIVACNSLVLEANINHTDDEPVINKIFYNFIDCSLLNPPNEILQRKIEHNKCINKFIKKYNLLNNYRLLNGIFDAMEKIKLKEKLTPDYQKYLIVHEAFLFLLLYLRNYKPQIYNNIVTRFCNIGENYVDALQQANVNITNLKYHNEFTWFYQTKLNDVLWADFTKSNISQELFDYSDFCLLHLLAFANDNTIFTYLNLDCQNDFSVKNFFVKLGDISQINNSSLKEHFNPIVWDMIMIVAEEPGSAPQPYKLINPDVIKYSLLY